MDAPRRQLHRLRGGDGPSAPASAPDEKWPDMAELEPYWESFMAFSRSYLERPIQYEFRMDDRGSWTLRAIEGPSRKTNHRKRLVYDPKEDTIEFTDLETDGGWVMEDAFGDQTGATSAL